MYYEVSGHQTFRLLPNGEREQLCNFSAVITQETHHVDGQSRQTFLTITGRKPDIDNDNPLDNEGLELPPIEVSASDFPSLQWILPNWGVQCVVSPGTGIKDDLRAAIQLASRPKQVTVYRHLGWTEINDRPAYVHAGGAITANGNRNDVQIRLPFELQKFDLRTAPDVNPAEAVRATINLSRIAPPEITWPLIAGTLAPLLGPVDFGIHLTGRTGTYKSELMSLFQSHYGAEMDARHLPGSWSSTANALEAQAFFAKNAVFVVDDFVPSGTSWQVRAYQATAEKLVRAQGNQAGRARLSDTASLQQTYYPRGIVLSTGEDTPEGHSIRARLLILEISPGTISTGNLTTAQAKRSLYPATVAAFIQHIASNPDLMESTRQRANQIREQHLEIGHTRTPSMLGRLLATIETFLTWAQATKALTPGEAKLLQAEAATGIMSAGFEQDHYLESADPCGLFTAGIRQVFGAGLAHVRTANGGIPVQAEILGWTSEQAAGELARWRSHGPCIGWINWNTDDLFIDITTGYNIIRKAAGNDLSLSKQTLFKRLKDAGYLNRADEARQRNTVRITAENHPRQVLAMSIARTLETQEVPNEPAPEREPGIDPEDQ